VTKDGPFEVIAIEFVDSMRVAAADFKCVKLKAQELTDMWSGEHTVWVCKEVPGHILRSEITARSRRAKEVVRRIETELVEYSRAP